ncbi:MAG: hypothetical protein A2079_00540 [Geobacteraceae bacterium GWC2_48_7]|nr:MAG: hypothetical protein A2079_00540 [Geobacteraceae bacterium GWC2_48_7]
MPDIEMTHPNYRVLVVAYDEKSLAAMVSSLESFGVNEVACSTFLEAEKNALCGLYKGLLVDLATMIKAKAEERVIANTLTRIYPVLRVKTMGSMLIPMAMAGDAKQDKSLSDFFVKTCTGFTARTLRFSKRRDICIPTHIRENRGFTLNFSWNGIFIADMHPERFSIGEVITVTFPKLELEVELLVARIQGWGERRPSGIGVKFRQMSRELEDFLFTLLKSDKDKDRDRLIT